MKRVSDKKWQKRHKKYAVIKSQSGKTQERNKFRLKKTIWILFLSRNFCEVFVHWICRHFTFDNALPLAPLRQFIRWMKSRVSCERNNQMKWKCMTIHFLLIVSLLFSVCRHCNYDMPFVAVVWARYFAREIDRIYCVWRWFDVH